MGGTLTPIHRYSKFWGSHVFIGRAAITACFPKVAMRRCKAEYARMTVD